MSLPHNSVVQTNDIIIDPVIRLVGLPLMRLALLELIGSLKASGL
jgi:hypothetical protein